MRTPAISNCDRKSSPCPFCGPSSLDTAVHNSNSGRDMRVASPSLGSSPLDTHVLVVHHRPDTLEMIAAMFRKLGYLNVAAVRGIDALQHFSNSPCDLLFTDLDMPSPDGYLLSGCLKQHHPQAAVLVMTGCCQAEIVDLMMDDIVDAWLYKPFTTSALCAILTGIGIGPGRGRPINSGRQGLLLGMKFDPPVYK